MKKLLTLTLLLSFGFGQINSTANSFFMGSSVNFESLYLPMDFGSSSETSFLNGVQYLSGAFAIDDVSQIGATFSYSTFSVSSDFGDIDESNLNNVHLFYKMFMDEDSYYEIGFVLNIYDDVNTSANQGIADISNNLLFSQESFGINLGYALRSDLNDNSSWYAVNGLVILIPNDEDFGFERETLINVRSLLGVEMFFDEISLSLNYKIYMNISEEVDDFNDRFLNTFYPQIKYIIDDQFEISANYQIYTHEDLKNFDNRIGFGFTAFFE